MSEVVVTDNPELSRYEARIGGELAGFAEYHRSGGSVVFTHTEVPAAFEGQGVASALVRTSLEEIRAAGTEDVVAQCPFYARWIANHPDYADLLHTTAEETR